MVPVEFPNLVRRTAAEEGVLREPVSGPNSLIYGKIQGISTDSARIGPGFAGIHQ